MRKLLEQAIVHLLNDDQDKANDLFHQFVIKESRRINTELRESDDGDASYGGSDRNNQPINVGDKVKVIGGYPPEITNSVFVVMSKQKDDSWYLKSENGYYTPVCYSKELKIIPKNKGGPFYATDDGYED